jgi:hypothetical protein
VKKESRRGPAKKAGTDRPATLQPLQESPAEATMTLTRTSKDTFDAGFAFEPRRAPIRGLPEGSCS